MKPSIFEIQEDKVKIRGIFLGMSIETAKQVLSEQEFVLEQEYSGFDYNGYGITPKPHEIDHFWDLNEGLLKIQWDGFNVHNFVTKKNDGIDYLSLSLSWPVVKDESYWRSEVD